MEVLGLFVSSSDGQPGGDDGYSAPPTPRDGSHFALARFKDLRMGGGCGAVTGGGGGEFSSLLFLFQLRF